MNLVVKAGSPSINLWPLWGLATGCSVLAWAWMHRWFAQRLQGFTGDCLGAAQQVSEIAFYLGLALAWGLWPAGATP
jgi:adenosylcobinamide-GDP ribazoletransferase